MKTQIVLQQKGRYLEGDTDTPISLFLKNPQGILLESAEVDGKWGRYSVLASDFRLLAHCKNGKLELTIKDERLAELNVLNGSNFLDGLRQLLKIIEIHPDASFVKMPPITRALYGYLSYGISGLCLDRLSKAITEDEAASCLVLPGHLLLFDHLYNRLAELKLEGTAEQMPVSTPAQPPCVGEITCIPSRETFIRQVESIREQLKQGEAIQVVLSTRFQSTFSGDAFTLYRRLRRVNPSPYMFYMDLPEITMMGSSPELLVRCKANQLQLSPIAGTRKRGKSDEEDSLLAADLLQDPKERAEHLMLVDLGRNDLGRLARPGTVTVERQMEVERFSHVMHLTSRVTAQLDPAYDAIDIIKATFPAGTVSGAPKVRAMEIIAETEACKRGPYAGCIGWIGFDKDTVNLDLGITIRSLWIQNGQIFWQSGAGIVFDSVPENEYAECQNKAAIIQTVIKG